MARSRSSTPLEKGPDAAETEVKHAAGTQTAEPATMHAAAAGSTDGKDEPGMSEERTAPAAVDTAAAAEEAGTGIETVVSETVPQAGADMVSRMIYTGCYALAYGIVYSAVFVAQSLPQENPFMHGFRDGGKAAVDELGIPAAASTATP